MARNRVARYADTTDHRFLGDEEGEYQTLTARGRDMYDDLRWYDGYDHETAFRDAKHVHGLRRSRTQELVASYRADLLRKNPSADPVWLDTMVEQYAKLV